MTRLTPEEDSDESEASDLDFGEHELGQSFKMERRDPEKAREDNDESDCEDSATKRRRRGSADTTQSFMLYTPDEEKTVIRKFDRRLVLFVALLYMLSFLDRSSKSNKLCYSHIANSE